MVLLALELDTQSAAGREVQALLAKGDLLCAAGVLNVRWEEFSALDLCRDAGLHDVEWDTVSDDTPGCLTLKLTFAECKRAECLAYLTGMAGVEDYRLLSV